MYLGSTAFTPPTASYKQPTNFRPQTAITNAPMVTNQACPQAFGEMTPLEVAHAIIDAPFELAGQIPRAVRLSAEALVKGGQRGVELGQWMKGEYHERGALSFIHFNGMILQGGLGLAASAGSATLGAAAAMLSGAFGSRRNEQTLEYLQSIMTPEHFSEVMAYVEDYNAHGRAVSKEAKRAEVNLNKLSHTRNRGPYEQYLPD